MGRRSRSIDDAVSSGGLTVSSPGRRSRPAEASNAHSTPTLRARVHDATRWVHPQEADPNESASDARAQPRLRDVPPTPSPLSPRLDPTRTWTVLVGILDYPAGHGFAMRGRQDLTFDRTLAAWGVPDERRIVLLDRDATARNITRSLQGVVARTQPGDTLLFYFAGHGQLDARGAGLLASDRILYHDELPELFDGFRGGTVLLAADCCFSGALANVGATLHTRGIPTGVLASIDGSISTLQWTFTRSLIDAFAGRGFVDHDRDGHVSLADVAHEQRLALHARDVQRAHASWHGVSPNLLLRDISEVHPTDLGWCEFKQKSRWRPARVVGRAADTLRVRLCDITRTSIVDASADLLRPVPRHAALPVGTEVWPIPIGDELGTACVVAVDQGLHLVEYTEPGPLEREWLPASRLLLDDESS